MHWLTLTKTRNETFPFAQKLTIQSRKSFFQMMIQATDELLRVQPIKILLSGCNSVVTFFNNFSSLYSLIMYLFK